MRVLDLCCCDGGATKGYLMAGAIVVGVDNVDRPKYCGTDFVKMDAIKYLKVRHRSISTDFDLIHASPPCQERCTLTTGTNRAMGWGGEHDQLVPEIRYLLDLMGVPYVIEQPTGHAGLIRTDLRLCGDQFKGDRPPPWVQRHRDFEISGFAVPQPRHHKHQGRVRGWRHGQYHDGPYIAAYGSGGGKATVPEMQQALGIDWTDDRESLTEAIPPAYTEHIGRAFRARA